MSFTDVLLQQLIIGLSNGMIIALIALGYTMVYGILELINFAHGDLFMLGSFLALTLVGVFNFSPEMSILSRTGAITVLFISSAIFCGTINMLVEKYAYRPLRNAPRLAPLVSAIGVSFIFINLGLFWGGLPLKIFQGGNSAASPKDFPSLLSYDNLLSDSNIIITSKDILIPSITIPLMLLLTYWVKYTKTGKAMRAVAEDTTTAKLMGIDVQKITSQTFFVGGALAGIASVMYTLYNNTVFFQMGFRVGIDAFSAAVLGGIGSLTGAVLGGLTIGIVRTISDQFIATEWTNTIVFIILIATLVFRPQGIIGSKYKEKV